MAHYNKLQQTVCKINPNTRDAKNSFPLHPRVVNISLTNRCTARCSMCATNSSPEETGSEIIFDEAVCWISEIAKVKDVLAICFIGGEPFLRYKTLCRLTEVASEQMLEISVVTNCYWAKTLTNAKSLLEPLKKLGLSRLTISTDQYHMPYVPISYIENAIEVADSLGIKINSNIVVSGTDDTTQKIISKLKNIQLCDHISLFNCIPVGRGKDISIQIESGNQTDRCEMIISTVRIDYKGDVYACCGVGGFTKPLLLGSLKESSFINIIQNGTESPLVRMLAVHGPHRLAPELNPNNFSDKCHLCNEIMSNDRHYQYVKKSLSSTKRHIDSQYYGLSVLGGRINK